MEIELTEEIIQGCISNNRLIQNRLYKMIYPFLVRICYRYTNNKEDAISHLNMGFVKIVHNIKKYDTSMPAEPWLRTILIRSIIDELRKNYNHKMHIVVSDEMEQYNENAYSNLLNSSDDNSLSDHLLMAMKSLPETSSKIFNLFVVDEYSHKEIGELLGINETASRWHVHNAKKLLYEKLIKLKTANNSIIAK
nr:sigma-70 family RNA polymerase sigma factor [Bacteroidota bacterium]